MTLTGKLRRSPAVKRSVQAVTVGWGRLTSRARMTPGFLIVGGQRCGTTSMYRTLAPHPNVLKAVKHKGIHYFDTDYRRGPEWYRAHFPLRRTADAVERAYSAHAHELARGYEDQDFETALALEDVRLAGEAEKLVADPAYRSHSHQHHGYLQRGRYIEHLERLQSVFGRERMHVVDSHRFFTDPERVYDAVLDFLGLPHTGYPVFERHNARPRTPMDPALRERLEAHFEPYDERLAAWLGHPVSWRTGVGRPERAAS